jgi:hypothetical protein
MPHAMLCFAPKASQNYAIQETMTRDSEEGRRQEFAAYGTEMAEDVKNLSDVGTYMHRYVR